MWKPPLQQREKRFGEWTANQQFWMPADGVGDFAEMLVKPAQIRAQKGEWDEIISQQGVRLGEAQAIQSPDWNMECSPIRLLLAELEVRDFDSIQSRVQDRQVLAGVYVAGVDIGPRHRCCDRTPGQPR